MPITGIFIFNPCLCWLKKLISSEPFKLSWNHVSVPFFIHNLHHSYLSHSQKSSPGQFSDCFCPKMAREIEIFSARRRGEVRCGGKEQKMEPWPMRKNNSQFKRLSWEGYFFEGWEGRAHKPWLWFLGKGIIAEGQEEYCARCVKQCLESSRKRTPETKTMWWGQISCGI